MEQLPDFLGSVPAWITAGGMTTLVGVVLLHLRGIRKLKIEATQVEITAKTSEQGLKNADTADIRDHYAEEVKQLREQLRGQGERHRNEIEVLKKSYREEARASDDRHEACVRGREELRDQNRALKDLVHGLRRIITQASASQAIRIDGLAPGEMPDDIIEAARRVEELFAPRDEPQPPGDKPA